MADLERDGCEPRHEYYPMRSALAFLKPLKTMSATVAPESVVPEPAPTINILASHLERLEAVIVDLTDQLAYVNSRLAALDAKMGRNVEMDEEAVPFAPSLPPEIIEQLRNPGYPVTRTREETLAIKRAKREKLVHP